MPKPDKIDRNISFNIFFVNNIYFNLTKHHFMYMFLEEKIKMNDLQKIHQAEKFHRDKRKATAVSFPASGTQARTV